MEKVQYFYFLDFLTDSVQLIEDSFVGT